jgi:hypothetical protein
MRAPLTGCPEIQEQSLTILLAFSKRSVPMVLPAMAELLKPLPEHGRNTGNCRNNMEHNKGKHTFHYPLSPELRYTPMCEEFRYWKR